MLAERILLIISSMALGGAQRVLAHMANYWAEKGKGITVMTLDGATECPIFPINQKVSLIPLGVSRYSRNFVEGIINNIKRIHLIRKAIKGTNAEVIISFLDTTNILTLLAVGSGTVPVIVTEMSDPAQVPISWSWRALRRLTYFRANGIGVVTPKAKDYFPPNLQKRIAIIPNPVVLEQNLPSCQENPPIPSPMILYAGRLAEEKRIDLLLQAFHLLKEKHTEWTLGIIGDGPLRQSLEYLRDELRLKERVYFFGLVENPQYFLQQADIFVLCSRYEGFPLALAEAMACGLPVIATEYHYGVKEIITDGVNGLIVPPEDRESLSLALDRLMSNPEERERLGRRAREVAKRFSLEKVMRLWETLIDGVVSGKGK